eukprot:TRINITY_DN6290_c0_g5_i1.p1 TRINITY_DN6290_c0_g5~~TRINITY_DN6290_c0_g5_i1.p1  ORF type:complete len:223 (-),score=-9.90 TRINITY_DN6290_c0_g5_i1:139-807(-)
MSTGCYGSAVTLACNALFQVMCVKFKFQIFNFGIRIFKLRMYVYILLLTLQHKIDVLTIPSFTLSFFFIKYIEYRTGVRSPSSWQCLGFSMGVRKMKGKGTLNKELFNIKKQDSEQKEHTSSRCFSGSYVIFSIVFYVTYYRLTSIKFVWVFLLQYVQTMFEFGLLIVKQSVYKVSVSYQVQIQNSQSRQIMDIPGFFVCDIYFTRYMLQTLSELFHRIQIQ